MVAYVKLQDDILKLKDFLTDNGELVLIELDVTDFGQVIPRKVLEISAVREASDWHRCGLNESQYTRFDHLPVEEYGVFLQLMEFFLVRMGTVVEKYGVVELR